MEPSLLPCKILALFVCMATTPGTVHIQINPHGENVVHSPVRGKENKPATGHHINWQMETLELKFRSF